MAIYSELKQKSLVNASLMGAATVKPAAIASAPLNKCNAFKMFINSLDSGILIFIFWHVPSAESAKEHLNKSATTTRSKWYKNKTIITDGSELKWKQNKQPVYYCTAVWEYIYIYIAFRKIFKHNPMDKCILSSIMRAGVEFMRGTVGAINTRTTNGLTEFLMHFSRYCKEYIGNIIDRLYS